MLGRLVHPPHPATVAQPRRAFGVAGPLPPHPASVGRSTSALPTVQRTIAPHPAKASILRSVAQRSAAKDNSKEAAIKEAAAAADVKSLGPPPAEISAAALDDFFATYSRDDSAFATKVEFRSQIRIETIDADPTRVEQVAHGPSIMNAQTGCFRIFADVDVTVPPNAPGDMLIELGFVQAMKSMKIELAWGDGRLSIEHAKAAAPLMDTHKDTPPTSYPFYDKTGVLDPTQNYCSYSARAGNGRRRVWLEDQPGMPIFYMSSAAHLDAFKHIAWTKGDPARLAAGKRLWRATADYAFDTWLVARVGRVFVLLKKVSWTAWFAIRTASVESFMNVDIVTYSLERYAGGAEVDVTTIPFGVLEAQKSAYDTYFRK